MGLYKKLFQQTAIYGLATVIPRMFSFLLVPLYTGLLPQAEYGKVSIIFAWMIFFNVILAYGMETAFFRFYNKEENKIIVANIINRKTKTALSKPPLFQYFGPRSFLFLLRCYSEIL